MPRALMTKKKNARDTIRYAIRNLPNWSHDDTRLELNVDHHVHKPVIDRLSQDKASTM
jgi:hypothetical protein